LRSTQIVISRFYSAFLINVPQMFHTVPQKKNEFHQGVSVRIYLSPSVNKDGRATVFLRITIDRQKKAFNLKVAWPPANFDLVKEVAMPRHQKDSEVETINLIINEAKGKANRIKLRYFSDGKLLDHQSFEHEFETYESRDNFLHYCNQKREELYRNNIISFRTYQRHNTNLKRFAVFAATDFLPMGNIDEKMVERYDNWLRKKRKTLRKKDPKALAHNTVVTGLKELKTYLNHAIKDGHRIKNPFENYRFRYQDGKREALDREELQKLKDYFATSDLQETEKEVLRKFLFSCYTGLRVSDSAKLHSNMIQNGVLQLDTVKGKKFGKKVSIPLPDYAKQLIESRKGSIFEPVADQTCNDWLKIIAHKLNIHKHLTFHVSRDTFGTLFIELGGDVATLKDLMAHTKIETTMIYIKMSEKRKDLLMANFNKL
jgi:integrase/recombinase XerD